MMTIDDYIRPITFERAYGNCKRICEDMQSHFTELELVRGHYYCPIWGEREHWWLVAPDESIVDPTAIQFPSKGTGTYIPWLEGTPEPTGMCPNCGRYCYDGEQVHEECVGAFMASLMG